MSFPPRHVAFVLAATNHGTMIVNRHDQRVTNNQAIGVGFQLLANSCFDPDEVNFILALLDARRHHFKDGVIAIDGGANTGVHTIEWARHMHGWGQVLAYEAQEILFYALAGNVVLNNCLNARVRLAALGESRGVISVPQPNYFQDGSYGSLELRQRENTEFIGQDVSYAQEACASVPMINLDSLNLPRLDLAKIDVEGMEMDVLRGGRDILARHHPILLVEIIKSDKVALESFLTELGYTIIPMGINLLAIHETDPTRQQVSMNEGRITFTSLK